MFYVYIIAPHQEQGMLGLQLWHAHAQPQQKRACVCVQNLTNWAFRKGSRNGRWRTVLFSNTFWWAITAIGTFFRTVHYLT